MPPVVILRLRNMTALDATGLFALEEVAKKLQATKRTLFFAVPANNLHDSSNKLEFAHLVGPENICAHVQEALRRAEEVNESLEAAAAVPGS